MPANSRWDLIQLLRVNSYGDEIKSQTEASSFDAEQAKLYK